MAEAKVYNLGCTYRGVQYTKNSGRTFSKAADVGWSHSALRLTAKCTLPWSVKGNADNAASSPVSKPTRSRHASLSPFVEAAIELYSSGRVLSGRSPPGADASDFAIAVTAVTQKQIQWGTRYLQR